MFNVTRPARYRLGRPPLIQAVVQIRFPLVAHFQELMGVAGLQDALSMDLPYLDRQQVQRLSIALEPTGLSPSPVEDAVIWRLTNDEGWTLGLEAGAAALYVGGDAYHGIEDFSARFSRVLEALVQTGRMRRCDRIGVRFINAIESLPGDEIAWRRWFKPELLGWVGADMVTESVSLHSSITETRLTAKAARVFANAPSGPQAQIRHGVVPAGTEIPLDISTKRALDQAAYMLDFDLFIQAPQPFDPPILLAQFVELHAEIDAFFRWSLTDEGARHFEVHEP